VINLLIVNHRVNCD